MLLKGVNKRVIVIKNPESEIFEEAYFIIRSGAGIKGAPKQSKTNENEMVTEANRIISDYHNQQRSIIEKNGSASSVGSELGELSELDVFLNGGVKKEKEKEPGNKGKKDEKNKPESKSNQNQLGDTKKTGLNPNSGRKRIAAAGDESFEDEKFLESIQPTAQSAVNSEKYDNYDSFYHNLSDFSYNSYNTGVYEGGKSAFKFLSSKAVNKDKSKIIPEKERGIRIKFAKAPPRSFFVGVGFMSAVVILIRLFETIVTG
ncbi:MAG: hypothetical protein FWH10_08755 [Oscillospiraceae bacterium]|nr:hypothetical protein [Oscillospiraceae bacterium]